MQKRSRLVEKNWSISSFFSRIVRSARVFSVMSITIAITDGRLS